MWFSRKPKSAARALVDEKSRRVYYQDIVYAVCNALDRIDGRKPGQGIVCGTVDCPSTEVQDAMRLLVDRVIAADAKGIDLTSPTFSLDLAKRVARDLNTLETISPENERFKLAAINVRAWIVLWESEHENPIVLKQKRLAVNVTMPEELI